MCLCPAVSGTRTLEAISSLNKTLQEGRALIEKLPSAARPRLQQTLDEIAALTQQLERMQEAGKVSVSIYSLVPYGTVISCVGREQRGGGTEGSHRR